MDDKESQGSGSHTRGLVATAAIIALLVGVIGIGVADYYLGSSRVVTQTSVSTLTTNLPTTITKKTTVATTIFSNSSTTIYSVSTETAISTTIVQQATPTTTVTVAQTKGNISQVTVSEAVLYSGKTATTASNGTASLLMGFYNPNSTTFITSMVLESPGFTPIVSWDNSSFPSGNGNLISFASMNVGNTVSRGLTSVYTDIPVTTSTFTIQSGQTYQYVVFFANGSYVEGSLVAQ
jgi:hypothetical protein